MAKFYGPVGYGYTKETSPGVYREEYIERNYYGDVLKMEKRYQTTEHMNDDITINNRISIVSDPYAYHNFQHMRYIEWLGSKWQITSVDVQYPRLILTIGGVYNYAEEDGAS